VPRTAWNGIPGCSAGFAAGRAAPKKARKIWSGSSTRQCQSYLPLTPQNRHANNFRRDGTTPEKQVAQILAIYPIVKGQKHNQNHAIPPHHHNHAQPPKINGASGDRNGDLIDLSDDSATKPPTNGTAAATVAAAQEKKNGPLNDFQNDLKKDLPNTGEKNGTKAVSASADSDDEFHDAEA
jgi:hypothetical protein